MRKLKLKLEDLEVTAFTAGEQAPARGTVVGHRPPAPTSVFCDQTYEGYWTCDYTCAASCEQNCMTQPTIDCGGCEW